MEQIGLRFQEEYPNSNSGVTVVVDRLSERRLRDSRSLVWMLFDAVGLVLLIACTNVANLLTIRAMARQREASICAALGAGRWRLVRQGVIESLVLFTVGGVVGLVLGYWSFEWLRAAVPGDMPRLATATMDWRVFAYGMTLSLVAGAIFGAAPALRSAGARLGELLKAAGREPGGSGRRRLGRTVLVSEIALATVLLVGAGLLIRTAQRLMEVDPGFRPNNVLTLLLGLDGRDLTGEEQLGFFRDVEDGVRRLPGVVSASVGSSLPILGTNWTSIFTVADQTVPARSDFPGAAFNPVHVGYFETMGITLVKGRLFTRFDTPDTQDVIVVNERLVGSIWPGEDPIGKRLKQGWPESEGEFFPWREVVGVVGSVNQRALDEPAIREVFIPFAQNPGVFARVVIKTETDPMSLVEPAKAVIAALDPDLPVSRITTMDAIIERWNAPRRFAMWLLSAFAGLGLLLSAVGIYGVVAYSVAQRTGEFGIRMALGATSRNLFGLVLGQGLMVTLIRLAAGLAATVVLSRWVETFLRRATARSVHVGFCGCGPRTGRADRQRAPGEARHEDRPVSSHSSGVIGTPSVSPVSTTRRRSIHTTSHLPRAPGRRRCRAGHPDPLAAMVQVAPTRESTGTCRGPQGASHRRSRPLGRRTPRCRRAGPKVRTIQVDRRTEAPVRAPLCRRRRGRR